MPCFGRPRRATGRRRDQPLRDCQRERGKDEPRRHDVSSADVWRSRPQPREAHETLVTSLMASSSISSVAVAARRRPTWYTVVLLCGAAVLISYIDRTNISVAAIPMQAEFGWTET